MKKKLWVNVLVVLCICCFLPFLSLSTLSPALCPLDELGQWEPMAGQKADEGKIFPPFPPCFSVWSWAVSAFHTVSSVPTRSPLPPGSRSHYSSSFSASSIPAMIMESHCTCRLRASPSQARCLCHLIPSFEPSWMDSAACWHADWYDHFNSKLEIKLREVEN